MPLVGFLIKLFWMAGSDHQAHYRLDLVVEPFANIVRDYTCQDGDQKANHKFHDSPLKEYWPASTHVLFGSSALMCQ